MKMKQTVESQEKMLICVAALGLACSGCISYPFIDESLAQIKAQPLAAQFALPERDLVQIPDQGAEGLVGTWTVGYIRRMRFFDGHVRDSRFEHIWNPKWPTSDEYNFTRDGTFVKHTCMRHKLQREVTQHTYERGKWSYVDGVLTLVTDGMEVVAEGALYPNRQTFDVLTTADYKVEWLEGNEIILRDVHTLKVADGCRTEVEVDKNGVRTECLIKSSGFVNGRECGEITETVTLSRYKKMN